MNNADRHCTTCITCRAPLHWDNGKGIWRTKEKSRCKHVPSFGSWALNLKKKEV